jgi:hypothetical protein
VSTAYNTTYGTVLHNGTQYHTRFNGSSRNLRARQCPPTAILGTDIHVLYKTDPPMKDTTNRLQPHRVRHDSTQPQHVRHNHNDTFKDRGVVVPTTATVSPSNMWDASVHILDKHHVQLGVFHHLRERERLMFSKKRRQEYHGGGEHSIWVSRTHKHTTQHVHNAPASRENDLIP